MPRRFFHRSDSNQTALVETLRKLGLKVHIANAEYDLVCQYGGLTMLCEVRPAKGGIQEPREGRQAKFHGEFMVYWLRTVEDCVNLSNTLREWSTAVNVRLNAFKGEDALKVEHPAVTRRSDEE